MTDELSNWADRLEDVIARTPGPINRVCVLRQTASTQDAAFDAAARWGGLALIAGRQTNGRGRLGRAWIDTQDLGIAMTVAIPPSNHNMLSLRAGVGVARACDTFTGRPCRIRWPNDILEPGDSGRKLAGVLVETRLDLTLVGIGVNVLHQPRDWPKMLRNRAASLAQVGSAPPRIDVACSVLESFQTIALSPQHEVLSDWRSREWLLGRHATLIVSNERISGRVLDIIPDGELVIKLDDGSTRALPAAAVSIDHANSPEVHPLA